MLNDLIIAGKESLVYKIIIKSIHIWTAELQLVFDSSKKYTDNTVPRKQNHALLYKIPTK